MPDSQNDQVGYGHPPRHTVFKKGQSGNPSGRPKKKRSFEDIARAELRRPVTVMNNGKPEKMEAARAVLRSDIVRAIKKGGRAAAKIIDLMKDLGADEPSSMTKDWSTEDAAMLRRAAKRLLDLPPADDRVAPTDEDEDQ
jgi:hypothetical protein